MCMCYFAFVKHEQTSEAGAPQSSLVLAAERVNFPQPLHGAAYPAASPVERHRADRTGHPLPLAIWNDIVDARKTTGFYRQVMDLVGEDPTFFFFFNMIFLS